MSNQFKKSKKTRVKTQTALNPTLQTQAQEHLYHNQPPQCNRFEDNGCEVISVHKTRIQCKKLKKQLWDVKCAIEKRLEDILASPPSSKIWKQSYALLETRLFRYRQVEPSQLLEETAKIIQALELFFSKVHNNEGFQDAIYLRSEQDFLLFFKHLFGKPYTLCNLLHFRKILHAVWQQEIIPGFDSRKITEHLHLWVHGIEMPLNPSFVPLHRMVLENPADLKKQIKLVKDTSVYCHVNHSDCLGLTPLLLACHANAIAAYENLVKSGCDLFLCPLTRLIAPSSQKTETKNHKSIFIKKFAEQERLQFNSFEVLMAHKQYQQILNILSYDQIAKLKRLRLRKQQIRQRLSKMPDCCFEIHWKTYKGFLSFKSLPHDTISVKKKSGYLRIDYHVNNIQKLTAPGHYSILIKTNQQQRIQYYFMNHRDKLIIDLIKQIDRDKLKLRYQQMTKYGAVETTKLSNIKSIYKPANHQFDLHAQFVYINVSRADVYSVKKMGDYQQLLIGSELVDYSSLEKSEVDTAVAEKLKKVPKSKAQRVRNNQNIAIQFTKQQIDISDLLYVLDILDSQSPLFIQIREVLKEFQTEPYFESRVKSLLPSKVSMEIGSDYTMQIEINNIHYGNIDSDLFDLNLCAQEMNYEQTDPGLSSLSQTLVMDEDYSINASRFLGKTEKLLEIEDISAKKQFEELLTHEIQDSNYHNNQDTL